MPNFFFSFSLILFAGLTARAAASKIAGTVEFAVADGRIAKLPADLSIPTDWKGILRVETHGGSSDGVMESNDYSMIKGGKLNRFLIAFSNLPNDQENTVLVMSGEYSPGWFYQGSSYTKVFDKKTSAADGLKEFATGKDNGTFKLVAHFDFGKHPKPAKPSVGHSPVRRAVARNPNDDVDPRSYEVQWYHRPHYAAGFERGIPYAQTWDAQLRANQIGINRANMLNQSLRSNNWGYGILFGFR